MLHGEADLTGGEIGESGHPGVVGDAEEAGGDVSAEIILRSVRSLKVVEGVVEVATEYRGDPVAPAHVGPGRDAGAWQRLAFIVVDCDFQLRGGLHFNHDVQIVGIDHVLLRIVHYRRRLLPQATRADEAIAQGDDFTRT